jgi:hypothetical protein
VKKSQSEGLISPFETRCNEFAETLSIAHDMSDLLASEVSSLEPGPMEDALLISAQCGKRCATLVDAVRLLGQESTENCSTLDVRLNQALKIAFAR